MCRRLSEGRGPDVEGAELIIEPSGRSWERCGYVVHYKKNRLGTAAVDDVGQ